MSFKGSSRFSKLLVLELGKWVLGRGKHAGQTLDQVSREDPSYLEWVQKEASTGLSDAAYYALEDALGQSTKRHKKS